jgi:hypothetical protein
MLGDDVAQLFFGRDCALVPVSPAKPEANLAYSFIVVADVSAFRDWCCSDHQLR